MNTDKDYKKNLQHFLDCLSYEEQVIILYKMLSELVEKGGIPGPKGDPGEPGFSPTVSIQDVTGGHVVIITDEEGEHTFTVMNGERGDNGQDGVSPTVSISEITNGHRVTITDATGEHVFDVMNGTDGRNGTDGINGTNGQDGVSPTVSITDITNGHRITITDADGEHSFDVVNGTDGRNGTDGINGTNGQDGVSPTVSITNITNGHRITITDVDGEHVFDVVNGTDGRNGTDGINGTNGQDGISPTVSITDITNGHRITITDATGEHSFDVVNGTDGRNGTDGINGTNGQDGVSPTVSITDITNGHRITITDATGEHSFDVVNGAQGVGLDFNWDGTSLGVKRSNESTYVYTNLIGQTGVDGISPTVTVTDHATYHHIEITSAGGTESFDVYDGEPGSQGPAGPNVLPTIVTSEAEALANHNVAGKYPSASELFYTLGQTTRGTMGITSTKSISASYLGDPQITQFNGLFDLWHIGQTAEADTDIAFQMSRIVTQFNLEVTFRTAFWPVFAYQFPLDKLNISDVNVGQIIPLGSGSPFVSGTDVNEQALVFNFPAIFTLTHFASSKSSELVTGYVGMKITTSGSSRECILRCYLPKFDTSSNGQILANARMSVMTPDGYTLS